MVVGYHVFGRIGQIWTYDAQILSLKMSSHPFITIAIGISVINYF